MLSFLRPDKGTEFRNVPKGLLISHRCLAINVYTFSVAKSHYNDFTEILFHCAVGLYMLLINVNKGNMLKIYMYRF